MAKLIQTFSWRTFLNVLLFGIVRIMATMVMALQAPFYPAEAEKKGLSALEYGLVFGCFELFSVIFGPLVERLAKSFPGRTVFLLGTMMLGGSMCAFGFLDRVNGHWEFFIFSIIIRFVEAFAATAIYVMASAALYQEFPARMATISAVMETCTGVGMSLGPPIGGLLFQVGGFTLPFLAVGIAISLTGAVGTCVIPTPPRRAGTEEDSDKSRPSFFKVLKLHSVRLGFMAITISNLCLAGMIAVLEPYLRKFSLTTVEVSLMFVIYTGTYTIFGLFWGVICDRTAKTTMITLIGLIFCVIAYSCTGPISNTMGTKTLGLIIVALGLVLNGIGINAVCISSMLQIVGGIKNAYPGDDHAYTTLSGLVSTAFCLGGFIGPIAAGAIVEFLNFSYFFYLSITLHGILIVLYVYSVTVAVRRTSQKTKDENSSLVQSNQTRYH